MEGEAGDAKMNDTPQHSRKPLSGGKAARARRAAASDIDIDIDNDNDTSSRLTHRAAGGPPLATDDSPITLALESVERRLRVAGCGLQQRKEIKTDNHGSMVADDEPLIEGEYCNKSLRVLNPAAFPAHGNQNLTSLNLSRNELSDLPLLALPSLTSLDISRNWFRVLPDSLKNLAALQTLTASHNMLRPGPSLNLPTLSTLPSLTSLDIRFNQKCGNASLVAKLQQQLPSLTTLLTSISFPPPPGSYVGASAADRDPHLLRSQLEPWTTSALRRRIVGDFGGSVLPDDVGRPGVMEELLRLYALEPPRAVLRTEGVRVDESILARVEEELKKWSESFSGGNKERESVNAEHYMILTSPIVYEAGSKKAGREAGKLAANRAIWDVAMDALRSVDAEFARECTAVAVTHNFRGSPHIDRQNVGPFYGLSVGPKEGTGGIMVEASARVTVEVDTVGRLGRVDGRYPHWVVDYDAPDRWSLIYYRTLGEGEEVGSAVFSDLRE